MESALDKGRFEDLWSRVATATDAADCEEAWRELVQSYSEPERFYHSDKHVAFCLSELDTLANGPVQRVTVFPEVVKLLESLGSDNNHNCVSCQ